MRLAALRNDSLASLCTCFNCWRQISTESDLKGLAVWCTLGMCPKINLNGAFFIVAFSHEFRVYWARGRSEAQVCW